MTSGGARSAARAAAVLLAAGVVALGLYGLEFLAALPHRLPSPSDWQEVAARLGREAHPGDAVALAPWWAERARAVVPSSLPVLAFPRIAGEDLPGVRRVWLVALPGVPGGEGLLERDLAGRGVRATPAARVGGLELSRFDLTEPVLPLFRLSERIDGASVSPASGPHPSREVREVDLLPRDCLVAQPSPGRSPLTLAFPAVPLGRTLRVFTGIVGEAALQGEAPVEVAIALDGRQVALAEEPPAAPGWHRTDVDTATLAGRTATLTVTLRTADRGPRPLCLEAYALR